MLLRRVNDMHPVLRMRDDLDRLFDRFFGDSSLAQAVPGWCGDWVPSIDIVEAEKEITVRVEVPGVEPKDLDITVTGDVLTIAGEKKETTESKGENFYRSERRFGSFRRSVQLPASVNTEKLSAEHKNGVVLIRLPKRESAVPKRIPVHAG